MFNFSLLVKISSPSWQRTNHTPFSLGWTTVLLLISMFYLPYISLESFHFLVFFKYNIKHREDCFYRIKQTISEGITKRASMSPYGHIERLVSLLKPQKPRHDPFRSDIINTWSENIRHDQIISTRHICLNGADELCNQRKKEKSPLSLSVVFWQQSHVTTLLLLCRSAWTKHIWVPSACSSFSFSFFLCFLFFQLWSWSHFIL